MEDPLHISSLNLPASETWQFIFDKLSGSQKLILLYVLESEGSSPGRRGFKMAVAEDGGLCGTIGGGIMEHKLVEKAKLLLLRNETTVQLMRQFHDKTHAKDQSGMICSGSQLNAFIPVSKDRDKITIETILKGVDANMPRVLQLSPKGIELTATSSPGLQYNTDQDWIYTEALDQRPVIHIIGGGHVALALSELMHFLGFYIRLYDDRPQLNTIEANSFVHEKIISPYNTIGEQLLHHENDFVVIMTVGYRTDTVVLKQLIGKKFSYLGLLGSDHKIKMLMNEMIAEGIDAGSLSAIHTPIGINIFSKTAREIAVSIAAEIIRERNRDLPTGRSTT